MKRIHLFFPAVLVAAIAIGSSSVSAQQPTSKTKAAAAKGSPQKDSLKTLKKDIKANKAARKIAKAKGDTTTAKALKGKLRSEKKTKTALKAETAPAPVKKP